MAEHDTWKEKNADDAEFAANKARMDAETAHIGSSPTAEWKEQEYPPRNRAEHPGRKVHREVFDKTSVRDPASGDIVPRTYVTRYDANGNVISQGY